MTRTLFSSPCWLFSFLYSIHIRKRRGSCFKASNYSCQPRGTPCFMHKASNEKIISRVGRQGSTTIQETLTHYTRSFWIEYMLVNTKDPVQGPDHLQFGRETVLNAEASKLVERTTKHVRISRLLGTGTTGCFNWPTTCDHTTTTHYSD